MSEVVTLPDAQAMVVRVLKAAGIAGGRIHGALPASPAYPLVLTEHANADLFDQRSGTLEGARIQTDCYAATSEKEARDLAYAVDSELRATMGSVRNTDDSLIGWVSAIVRVSGPTHLVEPGTSRQRYTMEHVVYGRAAVTPTP